MQGYTYMKSQKYYQIYQKHRFTKKSQKSQKSQKNYQIYQKHQSVKTNRPTIFNHNKISRTSVKTNRPIL